MGGVKTPRSDERLENKPSAPVACASTGRLSVDKPLGDSKAELTDTVGRRAVAAGWDPTLVGAVNDTPVASVPNVDRPRTEERSDMRPDTPVI